jgi:AcrR family transcriptional regulator
MTPPRTTSKGETTRQRIIDVAARAFLEHGYAGTSLNDIIGESGVTKGGFYFHFASKAEVAVAALESVRFAFNEDVMIAAGYHEKAVDQIAAMVRALAAQKRHEPSGSAMARLCRELAELPGVADQLKPFDAWVGLTADLMRRAQAQGDMDPTIDVDSAARFAVTAYLGIDQLADVSGNPDLVEELVDEYLTFCFRAVGIAGGVPAP